MNTKWANTFSLLLVAIAAALVGSKNYHHENGPRGLNASHDSAPAIHQGLGPDVADRSNKETADEIRTGPGAPIIAPNPKTSQ